VCQPLTTTCVSCFLTLAGAAVIPKMWGRGASSASCRAKHVQCSAAWVRNDTSGGVVRTSDGLPETASALLSMRSRTRAPAESLTHAQAGRQAGRQASRGSHVGDRTAA
jgi:hypothetical protein